MKFLTSILGGWYGYAAAFLAGALIAGSAAWTVQGWRMGSKLADCRADKATMIADSATASIAQIDAATARISGAAGQFQRDKADTDEKFSAILKQLKGITHAKPLPPDCRPDPERVRILTDAYRAAKGGPAR